VVSSLIALRGVDKITAIVLLAELGDISRFESPRQLMAFLGLVPSEHSSGQRRRKGGITLTGNGHARRVLIESAWTYRFPARQTRHLKAKAHEASETARRIAWKAQTRLCGRYRTLTRAGKNTKLVCVAIARELAGFIWDIVRQEMPRVVSQAA
jgi:transposase